jgi:hypothetical protein
MIGGLEVGRRVPAAVAAALLAMATVVPLSDPVTATANPVTVADPSSACPVTVGTATTDPALATDAARALAAGYATTDCMPNAELLAAAEARAALPLGDTVTGGTTVGAGEGTSTGTSAGVLAGGAQLGTAGTASLQTTTVPPPTTTTPTTASTTTAPSTETTTTDTSSTETTTTLPSGDSGDSGDHGGSGDEGDSGNSGNSGDEGDSGNSGNSGDEGDSGNSGNSGDEGDSGNSGNSGDDGDSGNSGNSGNPGSTGSPSGVPTVPPGADGTTAAGALGWGQAQRAEDFATDPAQSEWSLYDGPGHGGNGLRSPSAISVTNGILTIAGDADGTTGGMSWGGGAKYGRWEARVRAPVADPTYNAVMLLWPDEENFPVGGEIDFMEMMDETRQKTDFFLHYGEDNRQLHGETRIDGTQWHNWAVEWAPDHITAYVDGQEWFTTTQTEAFPPGPMHLTLQLDWFPQDGDGAVQPSAMYVDWVRYYPIDGRGPSGTIVNSDDSTLGDVVPGTSGGQARGGSTGDGTTSNGGQDTVDDSAGRGSGDTGDGGDTPDGATGADSDVAGATASATTTIPDAAGTTTPEPITVTIPSIPGEQASARATADPTPVTTSTTTTS